MSTGVLAADLGGVSVLDWGLLGLLVISVLLGLWRGLVFEVMSLGGWVLAWIVGLHGGPLVGQWLNIGQPGSMLRTGVGFVVAFAVTLLACGLAARMVRALVAATPLSGLDRLLGGVFGVARGLLLLLVLATVISWTPLARADWWQASQGARWLASLQHELRPWLPERFSASIPVRGA
ncbi:MAG TPA: CvpA family protein [Ideonella sp.]|uniref:CvpA family protein n=1 Tax=Ideonella sp. TaxID=1929293 RepID=UPI002C9C7D93|nr:CvpA family protein [Ideonella sp.]HSI50452.1 CvpA family protein [Ideonella sp.]